MTWKKHEGICNHCECGNHAWAPVGRGLVTLVSPEDARLLLDDKWFTMPAGKTGKRVVMKGHPTRYLHHQIIDCPKGFVRDHKDRNRLDNRRGNLRIATLSQNNQNRSRSKGKLKGVKKNRSGWSATIKFNNEEIFLGYFRDQLSAARAYDRAAIKFFGEFAAPNFEARHVGG